MNNKKILALLLAFAMMFSSITVAFADATTTIGADAAALKTMGVLQGENSTGVTTEYLAKTTTRMQAAIMFLRLKGLEEEAMAFTGTTNFADANTMTWAQGKAMMAYLKANPQLGWVGADGGKFNPLETITVNQYYKVMLEALGYKQNTAEVVGDFAWTEIMTFAASKGLVKLAANTSFTNNDVAIATIEALKTNAKGTTTTLATSMVDAGMINKDAAIAAGLYEEATTAAAVKTVKAVANNKIEVEFTAAVTKAYAENAANYKVVVKGSTTALEVKSAVAEGATKVVLETAAQTAGTAYTMTVGAKAINFVGIAKDAAAPKVDSVKSIDTNLVEVNFDKVMDTVSATNVANFTLNNNAAVKSAELSTGRKTVTLTTEGVANGKLYTLKIENVKSSDLVAIKSVSKNFTGKTDTTAPKVKDFKVVNNSLIRVWFSDESSEHGISKASAETLANWSINDLAIESVTAIDKNEDAYGYYELVEIVTAAQTAGKSYTLTINNLVDGSTAANTITDAIEKDFKGAYADTAAPTVKVAPAAATNKTVEFTLSDKNALSVASATDLGNYEITYKDGTSTETLAITKAAIKDTDDMYTDDGRTIVLTTDEMDSKFIYTLVIKGVSDEFGNEIKPVTGSSYKKYTFRGMNEDLEPAYVTAISAVDTKTVKVTFSEKIEKASAQDPTNYSIKDLGAAVKASLNTTDNKTVTLTTSEQTVGKSYTLTINGINDLSGNQTSNAKVSFVAARTENDTTAPEVAYIEAMYKDEIKVHFTEAIKAADGIIGNMTLVANGVTFTAKGTLLDDETTVIMTPATPMTAANYIVTAINNVDDKTGNDFVAPDTANEFWGTTEENMGPEVTSWEQTDVNTIRVTFSEPVIFTNNVDGSGNVTAGIVNPAKDVNDKNFPAITWDASIDPEADKDNAGYSTVDFIASGVIPLTDDNTAIKFNFTALVKDYAGTPAIDADDTDTDATKATLISTYMEDEVKPEISSVDAVNVNKIVVTFTEEVKSGSANLGTYKISYDDNGTTKYVSISGIAKDSNDGTKANIATSTALNADFVYTIVPLTGAKDLAGNVLNTKEVSFDFTGTNVKVQDYLKGVEIINANSIKVTSSKTISVVTSVYELDANNAVVGSDLITGVPATGSTSTTIALTSPVLSGTNYLVTIDGMTYKFSGIVENTGIIVAAGAAGDARVTFSGMDVTKQTVTAVLANGTALTIKEVGSEFQIAEAVTAAGVVYVTVTRTADSAVIYAAKVVAQ
ncbi:MAG: Ig-like domain-containing domain [Clostridia bacterium]